MAVQRLFSTFPNSWPGAGLLLLRFAAGFSLVGIAAMHGELADTAALFLRCTSVGVAILLLLGLATPVAGILDAAIQVGIIVLGKHYDSSFMLAAALGAALAMLGPGAWSMDAWVFGRKRIV